MIRQPCEIYDLNYYKNMAKELEQSGAHILAIKDMAGLLKPEAHIDLISELKETVDFQFTCIHMIRVEMVFIRMQERLKQVLILLIRH